MNRRADPFLLLWLAAIVATTAAFVVHLAIRVESLELGYELGRTRAQIGRLREVRRVLELELASHKAPERIERIARTLLDMDEPPPERIIKLGRPDQAETPVGVSLAAKERR